MRRRRFDLLTQVIYAGACEDRAVAHSIKLLADYHGCTSGVFILIDGALQIIEFASSCGPFTRPDVRTLYLAKHVPDDHVLAALARLPLGEVAATDQNSSRAAEDAPQSLSAFYHSLDLYGALGGPVLNADGRIGLVVIHRGDNRPPFTDREIATFRRLLVHFAKAIRLRKQFSAALDDRRVAAAALESCSQPILVVDPQATVLQANARARALLAQGRGLNISRSGRLQFSDGEAANRFLVALGSPQASRIIRLRRADNRPPYVLRLNPAVGPPMSCGRVSTVVHVFDPDHRCAAAPGTLMAALGLSSQAAALVASMLSGNDLSACAALAGVSRNTAKFHLHAAFAATGTARQSDLIRLAAELLRDLGEPPRPPQQEARTGGKTVGVSEQYRAAALT